MASATPLGDDKYKLFVELGYNDKGKRIRKTKTVTAKSNRALNKAITAFEIEVHEKHKGVDVENITFEDFVDRWMKLYVKPECSIRTRDTYNTYLRNGIMDEFRNMKLSKIKTFHIVQFFKEHKEAGGKTLQGKHLMLRSIFTRAKKWDVISKSPMDDVEYPKTEKRKREIYFYDQEQMKYVLDILDAHVYKKNAVQAKLAMLVGLRMSEIAGIRIENINFNENSIYIDKTLQYDKETKQFSLGPTKTKKPRTVYVSSRFMNEIKEYVKKQRKLQIDCGQAWNPLLDEDDTPINFLFTNEVGYPNHIKSMGNEWIKIVKRHNLPPLNFHGLRHTCASFMLSQGVDFKKIQEQLGHNDIRETMNTYSHLTPKDRAEASNVFNEIL
ncbi:site-specific integrase [Salibacterium salarium]|uniref:Site-specific integrase n=1 Tax=Salibacterium salarium TaxID=284579 RepID=A0A428N2E1_9BACI|nr:site-specific integrase [Salibacterium salarium]RSL32634.1 site-specific integrase [Salibacterium salarium]